MQDRKMAGLEMEMYAMYKAAEQSLANPLFSEQSAYWIWEIKQNQMIIIYLAQQFQRIMQLR